MRRIRQLFVLNFELFELAWYFKTVSVYQVGSKLPRKSR